MRGMSPLIALFPILALMAACGAGEQATETPAEDAVTWYGDVQPIVERSCTRCHFEGGLPSTDFTSYETAAPFAGLMATYVGAGIMPPAAADPSCRDYEGSASRILSDEERAVFASWYASGALEGDPAEAPSDTGSQRVSLKDPDMELRIADRYKPVYDATGNDYACFVVDTGTDDAFFINAMEILADQLDIVHHVLLLRDPNGNAREVFGDAPFDCLDASEQPGLARVWPDWELIGTWAPGTSAVDFGDGRGLRVGRGEALILQIHYFAETEDLMSLTDQSGIAFKTIPEAEQDIYVGMPGPSGFVIPAGDASFSASAEYAVPEGMSVDILGLFPHMHLLGKSYEQRLVRTTGEDECVVRADAFDFHNQEFYVLTEPLRANAGDVLKVTCTWDNSTANPDLYYNPPVDVFEGEGTDDEMCYVFTYLTVVDSD